MTQQLFDRLVDMPDFRGKRRILRSIGRHMPWLTIRSKYGPRLKYKPDDFTNNAAIFGGYGVDIHNAIKRLSAGGVFVDFGANVGLWSLVASPIVGPTGKVFSFEPQVEVAENFLRNKSLNNAHNVYLLPFAAGNENKFVKMENVNKDHTGVASVNVEESGHYLMVDMKKMSPMLAESFKYSSGACVKLDVEGAEYLILEQLSVMLEHEALKTIIVECNEKYLFRFNASVSSIYDFLKKYEFRPSVSSDRANRPDHYDEIFIR